MQYFSIKQIFTGPLIFLIFTLVSCQKELPFPEQLIGIWISKHEQYRDKHITISRDAVSWGSEKGLHLTVFIKKYSREEPKGAWTLFCEDENGVPHNVVLVVKQDQRNLVLKLKNREHVAWTKLKNDAVGIAQNSKSTNIQTIQNKMQDGESKTDEPKATPLEDSPVASKEQQAGPNQPSLELLAGPNTDVRVVIPGKGVSVTNKERQAGQNQPPLRLLAGPNTDVRVVIPGKGVSITSGVPKRKQKRKKQPQRKIMQPRKVILGFKPNSLELTHGGGNDFYAFLSKLKQYPRATIWIKGFVSAKTNSTENIELSTSRAQAVEELLYKAGIDPIQVEIVGMGNQEPIASNDTRAGREKNRRVEIVVISDGTELPKRREIVQTHEEVKTYSD